MTHAERLSDSRRLTGWPVSGCGMRPSRRFACLLSVFLAMCLGPAVTCRAGGLVIEAPSLTVAPGSSGSFDVLLIDTDPVGTAGFSVSLDSLELAVSGPSGVAFTDVTINTIVPYIYMVSATTLPGSDPLNFGITFPNTGFTVADAAGASPFFQAVNPGDHFGLANVSYTVSPTFSGTDTISITSLNVGTALSDIDGNLIPFTATNGSISATAVPEPSTLLQAATAVLIGLGAVRRRRWRQTATIQSGGSAKPMFRGSAVGKDAATNSRR
jgi:hypothetical protein